MGQNTKFHFLFQWQSTWHNHIHLMSYDFSNPYITHPHIYSLSVYMYLISIFTVCAIIPQSTKKDHSLHVLVTWMSSLFSHCCLRSVQTNGRFARLNHYITRCSHFVQSTWLWSKRMTTKNRKNDEIKWIKQ